MSAVEELRTLIRARQPGIVLKSAERTRALDAVKRVCDSFTNGSGREMYVWDVVSGIRNGESAEVEGAGLDETLQWFRTWKPTEKKNAVLVLCDPRDGLESPVSREALLQTLIEARKNKANTKTTIILAPDIQLAPGLQEQCMAVSMTLPDEAELLAYVQRMADAGAKSTPPMPIEQSAVSGMVRAIKGLAYDEACSVVAKSIAETNGLRKDAVRRALTHKKQIIEASGVLIYEEPKYGFDAVGGLDRLKEYLRARSGLFDKSESDKFGINPPKGILLVGVAGCGKTLVARCIAYEFALALVRSEAGLAKGGVVGETEAKTAKMYRTLDAIGPCVVLMDEVEKQYSRDSRGDPSAAPQLGMTLTWMQDSKSGCYIVATCNSIDSLKPEFISRFDDTFFVDLPDAKARADIFGLYLRDVNGKPMFSDSNLDDFASASAGYNGREIEKICQAARIVGFGQKPRRAPNSAEVMKCIQDKVPVSKTMEADIKACRQLVNDGRAIPAGGTLERDARNVAARADDVALPEA